MRARNKTSNFAFLPRVCSVV